MLFKTELVFYNLKINFMKNKFITFLICGILTTSLYCQDSEYEILKRTKLLTEIEEITDFKAEANTYYILNNNSLTIFDSVGTETRSSNVNNIYGIEIYNNTIKTVSSYSGVTQYVQNDTIPITTQAKFITSSGNGYYTCKITGNKNRISYDSQIVYVDSEGNETPFTYLQGEPAGLFIQDGKLYFLTNKNTSEDYGILYVYDLNSVEILSRSNIPVIHPTGLSLDSEGNIYTFCNSSNEIIKFKSK